MNSKPSYNYGSAARKLDYYDIDKKNNINKKRVKIKRKVNNKTNPLKVTIAVTIILALAMFIVYRYNVISEKNLMVINLKDDLSKQQSNIASVMADNYKNINLLEVESYAKQKLRYAKTR